jgi:aldose 1-epimerase
MCFDGYQVIRLHAFQSDLLIDPNRGMTVVSYKVNEQELIHYDHQRMKLHRTYGITVLYPTPNRIRDKEFVFEGKRYAGLEHGCARLLPFQITHQDENSVTGVLLFHRHSEAFAMFPFESRLSLHLELQKDGIVWEYSVLNEGTCNLPFGIALHPFFKKQQEASFLSTSACLAFETDENQLPTGKQVEVDYSGFVLCENLVLDTVFEDPEKPVISSFRTGTHEFTIFGSKEFHYVVLYTPQKQPFVCIEPQSCATDSINLYNKGLFKLSGLQILPPGGVAVGRIFFVVR